MPQTVRARIKQIFDSVVYSSPLVNRVVRNLNKSLSGVTSFKVRPYGVMDVKLNSGVHFKMDTNETSSVTKLLFWNGADRYEYTPIFEKLIKQCSSFIDVGSNTGYYSLLAGSCNKAIPVYALEPASAPLYFLKRNIQINNLDERVTAHSVALSDKTGQIEFFELDNPEQYHTKYNLAGTGSLISEGLVNKKYSSHVVPAVTMDDFVIQQKIKSVDLIKLDTEGTENRILTSAHQTLTNHKPIIICETLFNTIEKELEAIMVKYGYEFYNHKGGKLYKVETLKRDVDNGVRDCFFVHSEKVQLIQEFVDRVKSDLI
jgi:FkbM family methyltransferase